MRRNDLNGYIRGARMLLILAFLSFTSSIQATTTYKVLVAYTDSAQINAGGHEFFEDIHGFIAYAIAVLNDAYESSLIDAQAVLARTARTGFIEDSSAGDVGKLANGSTYYPGIIHALRDEYTADIVVLLAHGYAANEGICGRVPWLAGSTIASKGFAVVDWTCVINQTVAHEIGHIVGGLHEDDTSTYPAAYGHGFVKASEGWKTIMAVNPSHPRVNHYSNPNQTFFWTNSYTGTTGWADVASLHNNRLGLVANFREPQPIATLVHPVSTGDFGEAVALESVVLSEGFRVESGGTLKIRVAGSGLAKKARSLEESNNVASFSNRSESLTPHVSIVGRKVLLSYYLQEPSPVSVKITNTLGSTIFRANLGSKNSGHGKELLNFNPIQNGLYLVNINTGTRDYSIKLFWSGK